MHVLSTERRAEVVHHLVEGSGVRAASRLTGVHKTTILTLILKLGRGCTWLHNRLVRDLAIYRIEADEMHGFIHTREQNLRGDEPREWGESWLWLAVDIDELAGAEFLKEVKFTHEVYGKALGVTQAEELPLDVRLAEPLRKVGQAIVDYSLQLLAHASADPSATASVRKALKPIDDHRAASAKRGSIAGETEGEVSAPSEVTPKTPVPEVPE